MIFMLIVIVFSLSLDQDQFCVLLTVNSTVFSPVTLDGQCERGWECLVPQFMLMSINSDAVSYSTFALSLAIT